ncbi:MAG: methyltransferase domain-containing protein [Vulcanimicrobiota bacterium]
MAELSLLEETLPALYGEHPGFRPELSSLSYGETPLALMARLLDLVHAGPHDTFLDLGCGCGATNLVAASRVGRSVGVDIVPGAVEFARRAAARLRFTNTRFYHGDLLSFDVSQADIIYCAATAVSEWMAQQLARRSASFKPGARLIVPEHPLEAANLELVERHQSAMAWTRSTLPRAWTFYIYRKR